MMMAACKKCAKQHTDACPYGAGDVYINGCDEMLPVERDNPSWNEGFEMGRWSSWQERWLEGHKQGKKDMLERIERKMQEKCFGAFEGEDAGKIDGDARWCWFNYEIFKDVITEIRKEEKSG